MRPIVSCINLLCSELIGLSAARSLALNNEISTDILYRPSGTGTASVAVSQLGSQPYWSVNIVVNGQNVNLMVDTGSSDLYDIHYA